ncbi:hypothetical protein ACWNT5_04205 [Aquimarina sp. 433]
MTSKIEPIGVTFKRLGFNEIFKIISKEHAYIIPSKSTTQLTGKKYVSSEKLTGKLGSVYSEKFPVESNSIFRLLINIGQESFTTNFFGKEYSCGQTHYGLGLISIVVDETQYHIYRHHNGDFNYLIIECLNQTDFSAFKKVNELLLKSFGFLTGNWYQNEYFIFSYKTSNFETIESIYYESLGNSIVSNQEIINPSEFRVFMQSKTSDRPILTSILFPENTLAELIKLLKLKPELERTIDLLIEGNGINSPLIKCSIFHVALETIVGLINTENKKFFKPIKNSKTLNKLKEELIELVQSKKEEFRSIEFDSIVKKITYINTPFNKDKFLLAFELYQIELPKRLKDLLNNRNKFLHGKTPFKEGLLKTKLIELNLESDRIQMLVSILILKYCNYKGHIKNQAAYRLAESKHIEEKEIEIIESMFYKI